MMRMREMRKKRKAEATAVIFPSSEKRELLLSGVIRETTIDNSTHQEEK
jgi:hypothetical protein